MAKLENVKTLDMVNGEITKVAYDGVAYERVGGEAQKGDIVLLKEAWGNQNVGEFFFATHTINGTDSRRQVVTVEGNVHSASAFREDLELFRKVSAATKPSVEERVAEAEGEIEALKTDVASLKGEAEYKRIDKDEARAGDYVKYIDSEYLDICDYSFTIGKLYEIKSVDEDGDFEHEADDGERLMACPDDEELEFYRKVDGAPEPKSERLKVGDYAKVVQEYHHQNGEIIILRDSGSERSDTFPFQSERLDGTTGDIFGHRHLVRATDEEVAEAKRVVAEAAERKKWAEIGREVGEFKKGDVVQFTDDYVAIGIVEDVGTSFLGVRMPDEGYQGPFKSDVTLITPVEARFDR
ncbi:hypothetical protein P9429_11680 [Bacillus atrophaeus]|uniref:hypothetical protein n=1 Tax=Bacillus atrophaeus TaxID=1452 RepID=UPI002E217877|nr:hypothetical protein [Bacillus atrophaeus]